MGRDISGRRKSRNNMRKTFAVIWLVSAKGRAGAFFGRYVDRGISEAEKATCIWDSWKACSFG